MTESQLELGKSLKEDREKIYNQMKYMKSAIASSSRLFYKTEDCKENFDAFKESLLNQCDNWVLEQRALIDEKFLKI